MILQNILFWKNWCRYLSSFTICLILPDMGVTWFWCCCDMGMIWCYVDFECVWYGYDLGIIWIRHECDLAMTWVRHVCDMGVIWHILARTWASRQLKYKFIVFFNNKNVCQHIFLKKFKKMFFSQMDHLIQRGHFA